MISIDFLRDFSIIQFLKKKNPELHISKGKFNADLLGICFSKIYLDNQNKSVIAAFDLLKNGEKNLFGLDSKPFDIYLKYN